MCTHLSPRITKFLSEELQLPHLLKTFGRADVQGGKNFDRFAPKCIRKLGHKNYVLDRDLTNFVLVPFRSAARRSPLASPRPRSLPLSLPFFN